MQRRGERSSLEPGVNELAGIGGDELDAAVALVAVVRFGLLFDRGLGQFRLGLSAGQDEQGRSARGGDQDRAPAQAGRFASFTHERLLHRQGPAARGGPRQRRSLRPSLE